MEDYIINSALYFLDRAIILLSAYVGAIILYMRFKSIRICKKQIIYFSIIGIFLFIICQLIGGTSNLIVKLIYIAIICCSLSFVEKKNMYSVLPTVIISVAIALCLQYISLMIASLILYFVNYTDSKILSTLISCVILLLSCIALSSIRWLKKCFLFFESEKHLGLGLLLACYIIAFSLLITQLNSFNTPVAMILVAVCPLALTSLILWIKSIVDRFYKRKIADRADAFIQQQIADKDEYIQKLETEVATLAKQLHRDNHLLSSLDRSVEVLGNNHSETQREQIVEEIHTLFRERNEMITKEQQANKILPSTGIAIIDGALSEIYVKAISHNISFDLMVGEEIHYLVNNIISQTDLQTLLCDHIKDAIIAIDAADNISGKILVSIEKNDGIFEISIRDNGIGFETDTLAKLGLERVTTHAESGGSGIGFVTTFETLQKTKGTLIITEYENKTPFSKCVAFIFDGLHQFIIQSYRKEELERSVTREDILFL